MDNMDILDMGDYMEVVMTYKCRFCPFICTTIQEMGAHVKDLHLKNDGSPESEPVDSNENQTAKKAGQVDEVVLDESDHVMKTDQSSAAKAVLASEAAHSDPPKQISTNESSIQNREQIFQNVSVPVPQDSTYITVSPIIDNLVNIDTKASAVQNLENTLEKISTGQLGEVLNIPGGSNIAVPTINENGNMTFMVNGKTVELTIGDEEQVGVDGKEAKPQKIENLPGELTIVDESNCLGGENSETITKEVFLCGQCSTGFDSMEECKSHMFKEHDVNPAESDVEYETDGKVSIGTQVEGQKKRGRKRKGEVREDNDEDYRPKLDELEDSDVEWTMESDQSTRGSRSRRKIRPPKSLESDYYIGKTKSKRRENYNSSTVKRKDYNLRCNFEGFNCYAKFVTQEALDQHLKCHVQGENLFKCSECSTVFPQWSRMRTHLWAKHLIDTDLITCDICGVYKTDAPSKLLIHKEVHGEDRPYTCDTCGKCFKQFCQMKNHQITHEEVRNAASEEKWYHEKQCKICKRMFANKKCLDKHMQGVHGDSKPFACTFCSYTSSRKHMLQLHLRTHTHEKPFKCEICGYAAGDHNSMRRHKMRHSGQRPYKCKICPYSCIQAIALKTHVRNKHQGGVEEGVFSCDRCSFRTINEKIFKYHLEDHKNGLVPEGQPAPVKKKLDNNKVIVTTTNSNIQLEGELIQNAFIEIQSDRNMEASASNQLEMQVQTLKTGETTISVDDLAKITNHGGLAPSEISAAQLIQFALNAIAQNSNEADVEGENELSGVQTSVDSSSNQDGVTMHTIRFHLPTASEANTVENQINIGSDTFKEGEVYQIMESGIDEGRNEIQSQELENIGAEAQISQTGATIANNETVFLNIQGQNLPVNVISLDQAQTLMNQSATIQDLAQVSCLVKDSLYSGNNSVESLNSQGNMTDNMQSEAQE